MEDAKILLETEQAHVVNVVEIQKDVHCDIVNLLGNRTVVHRENLTEDHTEDRRETLIVNLTEDLTEDRRETLIVHHQEDHPDGRQYVINF